MTLLLRYVSTLSLHAMKKGYQKSFFIGKILSLVLSVFFSCTREIMTLGHSTEPLLRWISLSNKMIHTLIASTTFLIIHGTTIYTWAAKHWRSSSYGVGNHFTLHFAPYLNCSTMQNLQRHASRSVIMSGAKMNE